MAPRCVKTRQFGDHGLMETSVVTNDARGSQVLPVRARDGLIPAVYAPACRRSSVMSHAPEAWTGWS
jgi:hypothetical protein